VASRRINNVTFWIEEVVTFEHPSGLS